MIRMTVIIAKVIKFLCLPLTYIIKVKQNKYHLRVFSHTPFHLTVNITLDILQTVLRQARMAGNAFQHSPFESTEVLMSPVGTLSTIEGHILP